MVIMATNCSQIIVCDSSLNQQFFTFGFVSMTNDSVDDENWWYMPQGPFVKYQLQKMNSSQKEEFL